MSLLKRLENIPRPSKRPDNDPDLCTLQLLWVKKYGSEQGLAPVLRAFQNDPSARLAQYVARYITVGQKLH